MLVHDIGEMMNGIFPHAFHEIEGIMLIKHKVVLLATASVLLGGCVQMSTMMVNQEGKWVRCQASGAGWLGAPMAASNHSRCIEDLQKIGYVQLPDVTWGVKVKEWSASPVKIDTVQPGTSAAVAGLKSGDIIKMIDGQSVGNGLDVFKLMSGKKAGDTLRVQVERDGSLIETSSILGARK